MQTADGVTPLTSRMAFVCVCVRIQFNLQPRSKTYFIRFYFTGDIINYFLVLVRYFPNVVKITKAGLVYVS